MTTEPVPLEVLVGPAADPLRLRRMLATFPLLPVHGLDDHVAAADLCRRPERAVTPSARSSTA